MPLCKFNSLRLYAGREWEPDLRQIASAVRNQHFAYKTGFCPHGQRRTA